MDDGRTVLSNINLVRQITLGNKTPREGAFFLFIKVYSFYRETQHIKKWVRLGLAPRSAHFLVCWVSLEFLFLLSVIND